MAFLLALAVACGESGRDDLSTAQQSWETASEGRIVVATVGGEPIFDDCVADFATNKKGLSRSEALNECIDFELLAQEARRRGLATDEANDAHRREATRKLIDQAFYQRFSRPKDVPREDAKTLWDRGLSKFYNRAENRTTMYCRSSNADTTNPKRRLQTLTPEGEPSRAAKAVADAAYAKLRGRTNVTGAQLADACAEAASEVGGADVGTVEYIAILGNVVPAFGNAAFAIKEAGRVHSPVRTKWGWDIILLIYILPATAQTFDEALPQIRQTMFSTPQYEGYRRAVFERFLNNMTEGLEVARFDDVLGEPEVGPVTPPSPLR